jgi:hypothetical protein
VTDATLLLTCEEFGREQTADERGWRSYLTVEEDEPAEAVVCCPECAYGEFGSGRRTAAQCSSSAEVAG